MRFPGRAFVIAFACLAAPWACQAADGTITVTGTVTSATCTINGGTGSSFTVTLPSVLAVTLNASGKTAGRTPFSINLTKCSGSGSNIFVYFEPGTTTDAAGRLKNLGSATNVDIELLNSTQGVIDLGQTSGNQNSTVVNLQSKAATLNYFAQYRATGVARGGSVTSNVLYTIVYP